MKKSFLIIFCAAAAFALTACDSGSDEISCNTSKDCGNAEFYKCNILSHVCEERFPAHCANKLQDNGETDIDCGNVCGKEKLCTINKACSTKNDCATNNCVSGKCAPTACVDDTQCATISGATCDIPNGVCISCSDGVKNGSESDVDCGGTCSTKCAGGKACTKNGDCEYGLCEAGKCSSTKADAADPKDLIINEVFDSASSSPAFPLNNNAKACEFIEIANMTNKVISLEGLNIKLSRTDDGKGKTFDVPLSGSLPAKNLLIVHSCDTEMSLPEDAIGLRPEKEDEKHTAYLSLTSTATYDITISNGSASTDPITVVIGDAKSKSSFTRNPEFSATGEMKLTTSIDNAIAFATPGYCNNGGLFSKGCAVQSTCGNGTKDGTESDVDCGGLMCPKCINSKACGVDTDCASGYCNEGTCDKKTCAKDSDCGSGLKCNVELEECYMPETCSDGIKNQDETDVDCGGSCSACAFGQHCTVNKDCDTNQCNGTCTGTKPDPADLSKLSINEVMGSPKTSDFFAIQTGTNQTEFVEIINLDSRAASLDGIQLKLQKEGSADADKVIDLVGVIPANGVFVVSEAAIPMANDGANMVASLGMTNKAAYTLWLEKDGAKASEVTRAALSSGNGKSQNRNPDKDTANGTLDWHDNVSSEKLLNSPGYCANGGKFSENCKVEDTCNNGVKDGNESDVDCGGTKCGKCDKGKSCNTNNDCLNGMCEGSTCSSMDVTAADPDTIVLNEILDSGSKSPAFSSLNGEATACEFIELANPTNDNLALAGLTIKMLRTDNGKDEVTSIPLSGAIPAKQLMVVHSCAEDLTVPEGVVTLKTSALKITGTATYDISIASSTKESPKVSGLKIGSVVNSSYNRAEDFNATADMVKTTSLEGYAHFATPGYCVNGGLFSNNCAL
ncbi:MAG: hypothetical protein IKY83_02230 [Proteobacteria bacterium]|nr:hypothetical protein [Pseudomonadota bacterium]